MAGRIRAFDWAATPLGPMAGWPVELRTMVQTMLEMPQPAGVCWGAQAVMLYNDGYIDVMRERHPAGLGRPMLDSWGELAATTGPAIDAVMRGEPQRWEQEAFTLNDPAGGMRIAWYSASWAPVRRADGSVGGFQMIGSELTLDQEARQRLKASEARQRYLLTLSDAIGPLDDATAIRLTAASVLGRQLGAARVAFAEHRPADEAFEVMPNYVDGVADASGVFRYADYGSDLLAKLTAGETVVQPDIAQDPGLCAPARAALAAMGIGASMNVPLIRQGELTLFIGVNYATAHDFTPEEIDLVRETAARTWDAVERARAEAALRDSHARQQLLLTELQHRVRNILAVVRSVFSQTVARVDDLEDATNHFLGRLDSLSRAQLVTTRAVGARVDLEDLIRDELLSVGASDGTGVTIAGPDVALPGDVAELLGMAIHELTTNSVKFGALKVPGAKLDIGWRIEAGDAKVLQLHLTWAETGVPAVPMTPTRGFGSELILEMIPARLNASSALHFQGGGVRWALRLPLADVPSAEQDSGHG